jgi:hypothetical protein
MLPLTCRFCGTQTGEYAVPRRFEGLDIPPEELGYVDSRCDACQAIHGTVQEAEQGIENALLNVGGVTDDEKRQFIVDAGWSAPDAIVAAEAERDRRIANIEAERQAQEEAAA